MLIPTVIVNYWLSFLRIEDKTHVHLLMHIGIQYHLSMELQSMYQSETIYADAYVSRECLFFLRGNISCQGMYKSSSHSEIMNARFNEECGITVSWIKDFKTDYKWRQGLFQQGISLWEFRPESTCHWKLQHRSSASNQIMLGCIISEELLILCRAKNFLATGCEKSVFMGNCGC